MRYANLYRHFPAFRRQRMRRFAEITGLTADHSIIDVGGDPQIWQFLPFKPKVTFANIHPLRSVPRERQIICDGCAIPVPDKSFDIAFSNSVIEHVGSRPRQQDFARELQRVGCRIWLQTPDRASPIEVHTMLPFLQWLPDALFIKLARKLSVRRFIDDPVIFEQQMRHLLPLGAADIRALFPQAQIIRERFACLPKSLIAHT